MKFCNQERLITPKQSTIIILYVNLMRTNGNQLENQDLLLSHLFPS